MAQLSDFERLLLKRLESEVENIMEEQIPKFISEIEVKIKEKIGQIAIGITHHSLIERQGVELLIHLKFDK